MDKPTSDNGPRFTEDDIDRVVSLLPEELHEPIRWLMTFTREECHRELDLLVEKFKAVGVYHDKTTWSKIIRGRWNRDPRGEALRTPVIAAEKLIQSIDALRNNVRVEALRGKVPFVTTPTFTAVHDYVLARCETDRINRFGVIIGPTGAQKTASFKEIVRRRNHGSTRWLEMPENGAMGEFITVLAAGFGYSRQTSVTKKRDRIFDAIKPHHCIIVDNAQDSWREGETKQPVFSFMRRLQDETGCVLILSITPTFHDRLLREMTDGFWEQFEGRSGGRKKWLRLPDYATDEDVLAIAKAFEFADAKKHLKELIKIAREPGRIRRLFEDLQEAKILANAAKEPLTIDHVREARGED